MTAATHATFPPLQRRYAGYIFDVDGTLADSMPVHYRSWVRALRSEGARFPFSYAYFRTLGGMGITHTVEFLNEKHGTHLNPLRVAEVKEKLYWAHMQEIGPLTNVVALARELAAQGAKLAVASGGPSVTVRNTLRLLDVTEIFPVVTTHDDVLRGKPAPDMFLLAAERLGVPAADCVVFEDSPLGVQGAQAAGMDYVRVDSETHRPQPVAEE